MKKDDYGHFGYYLHQVKIKRDECCHGRAATDNKQFSFHTLSRQIQFTPQAVDFTVNIMDSALYIISKSSDSNRLHLQFLL